MTEAGASVLPVGRTVDFGTGEHSECSVSRIVYPVGMKPEGWKGEGPEGARRYGTLGSRMELERETVEGMQAVVCYWSRDPDCTAHDAVPQPLDTIGTWEQ